jgi:hypothetical protein
MDKLPWHQKQREWIFEKSKIVVFRQITNMEGADEIGQRMNCDSWTVSENQKALGWT